MTANKTILLIETVLCILLALILTYGAVTIFFEGSERKAADPSENIYTVAGITDAVVPALPVLGAVTVLAIAGTALGVHDQNDAKPAKDIRPKASGTDKKEWNRNPMSAGRQKIFRCIIFGLGVIFVVVGIANGSMRDVLVKAINVCTECVGLG